MLRRSALLPALALALLLTGCGGDDRPTTAEAGKKLAAWGADLEEPLTGGLSATQPWTVTGKPTTDAKGGCSGDEARRLFTATLAVDGDGSNDAGLESTRLTGALGRTGWDVGLPGDSGSSSVEATRTGEDATGAKLEVTFAPAGGGWSYEVSLRSACLPTG
jgi:hypothetical protein